MPEKFINVQIPLVDLGSDSDSASAPAPLPTQHPPPSAAASHTHSATRTPRLFPTVSDDESEEIPRVPQIPQPPARGSPTPAPSMTHAHTATPTPALPTVPTHVAHPSTTPRYQARMSVGQRPPYQLAPRDLPVPPYPRSTYEHGETSHRSDYRREFGTITAELRDTRHTFHQMHGSQGQLIDRMGALERSMGGYRQAVDHRTQALSAGLQLNYEEFRDRATAMERLLGGVTVVAVVAVIIAVIPHFFSRG